MKTNILRLSVSNFSYTFCFKSKEDLVYLFVWWNKRWFFCWPYSFLLHPETPTCSFIYLCLFIWNLCFSFSSSSHRQLFLYVIKKKENKNLWFSLISSQKKASCQNALFEARVKDMYNFFYKTASSMRVFWSLLTREHGSFVSSSLKLQYQGLLVKPVFRAERWTQIISKTGTHQHMHIFGLCNCACMQYYPEKPICIHKWDAF